MTWMGEKQLEANLCLHFGQSNWKVGQAILNAHQPFALLPSAIFEATEASSLADGPDACP